jgi:hypothetical protein
MRSHHMLASSTFLTAGPPPALLCIAGRIGCVAQHAMWPWRWPTCTTDSAWCTETCLPPTCCWSPTAPTPEASALSCPTLNSTMPCVAAAPATPPSSRAASTAFRRVGACGLHTPCFPSGLHRTWAAVETCGGCPLLWLVSTDPSAGLVVARAALQRFCLVVKLAALRTSTHWAS